MRDFFGHIEKLIQIGAAGVTSDYAGPNAHLYDLVEQYTADVPFYVETALRLGGPVLELGCGTGRVLISLARAGIDVTGVDLSGDMLAQCRRKLEAEPGEFSARTTLVQGDMRSVRVAATAGGRRLRDAGDFGLVLVPLFSFMHMATRADKLACLRTAAAHLREGGTLLMEVELESGYRETLAPVLNIVRRDRASGELLLVLHQSRREPDGTILLNLLNITVDGEGRAELHAVASRESKTSPEEMRGLMVEAGLRLEAVWGDYRGGPVASDAREAVIWAKR